MNMNTSLIELTGVIKRFGTHVAVDRLSMKVEKGEIVALLGRTGAGKSTVMSLLMGTTSVDEGQIRVAGVDPAAAQGAASEAGMGEEQGAERAFAEPVEPAAERAARGARQGRVGEDEHAIVAVQRYFTDARQSSGALSEQRSFVGVRTGQPLAQKAEGKDAVLLEAGGE